MRIHADPDTDPDLKHCPVHRQWWARAIHASVQRNGLGRKLHKSKDLSSTNSRPHSELDLLITGASPSQRKTHQLIQMMQISALSISLDTRMYRSCPPLFILHR